MPAPTPWDDHDEVLADLQIPASGLRKQVLVRTDSSGATHGLLDSVREYGFQFSAGFDLT